MVATNAKTTREGGFCAPNLLGFAERGIAPGRLCKSDLHRWHDDCYKRTNPAEAGFVMLGQIPSWLCKSDLHSSSFLGTHVRSVDYLE